MYTKVFEYTIIWECGESAKRYVVADNQEEADRKIESYREEMTKSGTMDFSIVYNPTVDLEYVIK